MDLSKVKPEFRKEIVRGGEAYLEGQLKIATSADARASGLAGMFTAAATALTAGVVIALFNPAWAVPARLPLMLGGAAAAICFLAGAVLCITAVRPADFWLPGCAPENWLDDVSAGKELNDCYWERAKHIQEQIVENSNVIAKNANLFKWGARLGITAPFAGIVVWALASACHWAS